VIERLWRAAEKVVASVVLVLMSPLLAVIAVAIKLESRGPVLFRQVRLGRHCEPFTMLKFRSMTHGASEQPHRCAIDRLMSTGASGDAGGLRKLTDDPRVTRVGAVLRKTSLDELPQLVNVLLGDMSLIGPRPALDYELQYYRPEHFQRFLVRPGLTGLWQVSGRARLGFEEMLDLDVHYVLQRSVRMELDILRRTPGAMIGDTA
jgi:lipopolysaccharide/colanic/teichoic acid biosynthesis glycosyltransferase